LLEQPGLKIDGAKAVVLGRSNIVGMPAALLPLRQNATVTICHSRNRDLPGMIRQADILIAAITRAACSNASATVCYICKKVLDFTHQSAYYTNTYYQPQFALIDGTGVRFSH
jgi:5,10-methylene-tetrahydrofolate dehydrogenase/methenyl tetrahydrofolate cyclohydrolase